MWRKRSVALPLVGQWCLFNYELHPRPSISHTTQAYILGWAKSSATLFAINSFTSVAELFAQASRRKKTDKERERT